MVNSLFSQLEIRDLQFKNRIFVSPMCQYSAVDGVPTQWHLVHLGSRAVGGAALVMVEATAVTPEGRISLADTGLWNETQAKAFAGIAKFIGECGAVPAIQLAHAGRKAGTTPPWEGGQPLGLNQAWIPLAPSALPFKEGYALPRAMTGQDIADVETAFLKSARLALQAGFEVIEIHMAHGYLLNNFLSPLSNQRTDNYGGSLENRMRLPLQIATRLREFWPAKWPVFVRVSATDWVEGGWNLQHTVELARHLKSIGIDLLDCSSGGTSAHAKIPARPGYQVPFAAEVRSNTGLMTGAVGMITDPKQADTILREGHADVVFLARELLRDPYWPLHAAKALGIDVAWPKQYALARA